MTTKPTLNEFRAAHTKLLRALELQIAQLGEHYAPVHLLVEREQLQEEIRRADAVMQPEAGRQLIEAMDPVQRHIDLTNRVIGVQDELRERVRAAQAETREVRQTVTEVRQAVASEAALREPRQHETDEHRKATTDALEAIRALLATVQQQAQRANWRSIIALILAMVALMLNIGTRL